MLCQLLPWGWGWSRHPIRYGPTAASRSVRALANETDGPRRTDRSERPAVRQVPRKAPPFREGGSALLDDAEAAVQDQLTKARRRVVPRAVAAPDARHPLPRPVVPTDDELGPITG